MGGGACGGQAMQFVARNSEKVELGSTSSKLQKHVSQRDRALKPSEQLCEAF